MNFFYFFYRFKSVHDLNRHIKIHDDQVLLCPSEGCDYTSKFLQSIKAHYAKEHEVNMIKDKFKLYQQQFYLLISIYISVQLYCTNQMHHCYYKQAEMASVRYACHICGNRYTRGYSLTNHLKKKHHFEWPGSLSRLMLVLNVQEIPYCAKYQLYIFHNCM